MGCGAAVGRLVLRLNRLKIDNLAKANLEIVDIVDRVVILKEDRSEPVMIATVEDQQLTQVLAFIKGNVSLLDQFVTWNCVSYSTREGELQIRDLVCIIATLLLAEAVCVVAVDLLWINIEQLQSGFVEVFGREANSCIARVDLDPFEVMSEKLPPTQVSVSEICLPLVAHIVDCDRVPLEVLFAANNIGLRIVVANLNRVLFGAEARDKQADESTVNLILLSECVNKRWSFFVALFLCLFWRHAKDAIFVN